MVAVRKPDSQGVVARKVRVVPLPDEVVVVDFSTARAVSRGAAVGIRASDAEMFKAEHTTPDGSGAMAHEGRYLGWVVGLLAAGGLLIVGVGMFIVGGVQAMAVGLAWVLAGYAVAWIVVWAAGLARAREEQEIEREIVLRNAREIQARGSEDVR